MGENDMEPPGAPLEKQKTNTSHFSSFVILVVDDDPLQGDIIKTILSDEGYQAYVASSAQEALEVAETLKPHVVLTDLCMYKMDGIKLTEKLRSQEVAPEVIIMSAFGTPVMIEESLERGAFSFMQKPLEKYKVLHNVNRAAETAEKIRLFAAGVQVIQNGINLFPL